MSIVTSRRARITTGRIGIGRAVAALCAAVFLLVLPDLLAAAPQPGFNEARVRLLIAKIEKGANAQDLKYRYFLRHRRKMFSKTAALALIEKEMAANEQGGSRRWFVLASVRAFALAHTPAPGVQDPGEQYLSIFESSAALAATPDLMREILDDFIAVASHGGYFGYPRRIAKTRETAQAILAAVLPDWWRVDKPFEREPDFARLARSYRNLESQVRDTIQKELPQRQQDFAFLRRIGLYFHCLGKQRSAEAHHYLSAAEQLKSFATQPEKLRRELYAALVSACRELLWRDKAIQYQKKAVQDCGGSRVALAKLFHEGNYAEQRDAVIQAALADLGRRREAVELARFLGKLDRRDEAIEFLGRSLASSPAKDELRLAAIAQQGRDYIAAGKDELAKALLASVDRGDYPSSMLGERHLRAIAVLQNKLAAGMTPAERLVGVTKPAAARAAAKVAFDLAMTPKKATYLPYEPVAFEFVVRNRGEAPHVGQLGALRAEGGPRIRWRCLQAEESSGWFAISRQPGLLGRRQPVVLETAPGEEYQATTPVASPLNLAPSYWRPSGNSRRKDAKQWPRFYPGDWIAQGSQRGGRAPWVKIKVEAPQGIDAEAMRWIEKSLLPCLEAGKDEKVDKQRYAAWCRELLERFPKSAYAKYAEYSLLLLNSPHGARVSELGFQPLEDFFGRYPEFSLAFPLLSRVLGRDVWGEYDALWPAELEFLAKLERRHPGAEVASAARRLLAVDARAQPLFEEKANKEAPKFFHQVHVRKSDFREFEPVTVECQTENISKQTQRVRFGAGPFILHLALPDGKVVRFYPFGHRSIFICGPVSFVSMAPGESYHARTSLSAMLNLRKSAALAKYPVGAPGTYYVSAATSPKSNIKLNQVKFVVRRDEGGAGTDSQWIRDHLVPLLRGPKSLPAGGWEQYVSKCSELLEKFPDSPYALYAAGVVELQRVYSIRYLTRGAGRSRTLDLADLRGFADAYPEYPFLDKLLGVYAPLSSRRAGGRGFRDDATRQFLLKLAKEHGNDPVGRAAATYVWDIWQRHRQILELQHAPRRPRPQQHRRRRQAYIMRLPLAERLAQLPLQAEDSTCPKIIDSIAKQLNCKIIGGLPDKPCAYRDGVKAAWILPKIAAYCEMRYVVKEDHIEFLPLQDK